MENAIEKALGLAGKPKTIGFETAPAAVSGRRPKKICESFVLAELYEKRMKTGVCGPGPGARGPGTGGPQF